MVNPKDPQLLPGADLVVLSDLHIGRGKNPETRRYHNLETFFYDDDFLSFCRYLCADAKERQQPFIMVLNGDVLDLLRVEPAPTRPEASLPERLYGQPSTPKTAPGVVRQILTGHPVFVQALAEVLAAGHVIVMLAGNHDIETQWGPVRGEIRNAIAHHLVERLSDAAAAAALERLVFRSWFFYLPGRIWIEHGCQYDPANAFNYMLRGELGDVEEEVYAGEHDMPLGNFFQRYLYNAFGHLTFIVPDARANFRYLRWFLLNEPRTLARVLVSHLPFAAQVLRRLTRPTDAARVQLEHAHQSALERIARSTGMDEQLYAIDRLKAVHGDALLAVRALRKQLAKTALIVGLAGVAGFTLWYLGFSAIHELQAGFGLRALLFLSLNVLMLAGVAGTLLWRLLRGTPTWKGKPLGRAAAEIARLLDVPLVTFGHTHVEHVARLGRPGGEAWYYNTGTWIAVFRHDELVPRERVQYTFLRVRGDRGELLHWSPGRGRPLPVIMVDDPPIELTP